MKISVIIPVYNCATYLRRCVESVLTQTYKNLEIICVNDGSTDESGAILTELMKKDSRIRVICQENKGVSAARNAGIKLATGEWITFVDADDAIESDMYENLLNHVTNDDIDIVHCGYKRISLDGTIKHINGTGKIIEQDNVEAAKCLIQGKLFVGSLWNKLYKATLFENVTLDVSLAINEDILANAELIKNAKRIVFYDMGKYLMYERKGSATSGTNQKKFLTDSVAAAEKIYQIYENTPVKEAALQRLLMLLIQLYRWYVRFEFRGSHEVRKCLRKQINQVMSLCQEKSMRVYSNYFFLHYFPHIYKVVYKIYDKIRIPNWDVN